MRYLVSVFILALLAPVQVIAAGPKQLAVIDRSLWPYAIETPVQFDLASRLEIIAFSHQLQLQSLDSQAVSDFVGRKSINIDSVRQWVELVHQRLSRNFQLAMTDCKPGKDLFCPEGPVAWPQLAQMSESPTLPTELTHWWKAAEIFYRSYLYEQMRLAALSPNISSEIATFDPRELQGYELPDRHFLFTFDDGPSQVGGNSDHLIPILRREGINATFFMLGGHLEKRLSKQPAGQLQKLYQGMCPASHGYLHKSHARLDNWQESVTKTGDLLENTFPGLQGGEIAFRPPYGQRLPGAAATLAPQHEFIVLWNIDSQDWNRKISAAQTIDRVQTLMLLWRRGMILYHDIHTKAQTAVPVLVEQNRNDGVAWIDCHDLGHFNAASL